MTLGQNTVSGKELVSFVNRLERIDAEKKQLGEDRKLIVAEAVAKGFSAKRIGEVLKIRAMKPHDRQEAEQQLSMYLHAIGMDAEAPLFSAVGRMGVDTTVKDQVIEAFKLLVPSEGEVIVKIGGQAVRLYRDKNGLAQAEDVKEEPRKPSSKSPMPQRPAADVPDCSPDEAEHMGSEAYAANTPITGNPFPFGDKRRPRWDQGWRAASGTDGMGPEED